jgi:hypothetical protein
MQGQQEDSQGGGGVRVESDMARQQSMKSFAQEFSEEEPSIGGDTDASMRTPALEPSELQDAKNLASEDSKKEGVLVSGPKVGKKTKEYKKNEKEALAKLGLQVASSAEAASLAVSLTWVMQMVMS